MYLRSWYAKTVSANQENVSFSVMVSPSVMVVRSCITPPMTAMVLTGILHIKHCLKMQWCHNEPRSDNKPEPSILADIYGITEPYHETASQCV